MGSTAEVVVLAPGPERLLDLAEERVSAAERCWSRFDPASELSDLNRSAGGWVTTSDLLWGALDAAREAWSITGGRFDPTILGSLVALGYDRTFLAVAGEGPAVAPAPAPGLGVVDFDASRQAVRLPAGVGLDLGGIGKGLVADAVADELGSSAESVCVSIGGDVAVRGPGPGPDAEWPVPVLAPDGAALGTFPLVDEALVQSTTAIRRWRRGDVALHHLVDPRTGWPASSGVSAAVVTGPRASIAEAVAKVAIVDGAGAGLDLLARTGHDGWLFGDDGCRWSTAAVRHDLVSSDAG